MWISLLAAALLVWILLSYLGRPYWAWVVALALVLASLASGGAHAASWWRALAGACAALALVAGVPALRRGIVSARLIGPIGKILPAMSATEREALEAGSVWWDAELFTGAPRWKKLLDFRCQELSARERAFLAGPVADLCRALDDDALTRAGDLPPHAWKSICEQGFMGMIIPTEFGGLGFSAAAQAAVIARLSSRSVVAAVTVMVPNSLGPAELLLHYGTEAQKKHYLPRLARGEEIPCFALTEPTAGSDAGSIKAQGVVCRGNYQGQEVLGMRLDWDKRYITLAPVATVVGLAFKLKDPDRLLGGAEEVGITCALIPAKTSGVVLGARHDPLGVPFLNGPTQGKGVFVPLEFIIGGPAMAGKGWGMLMQCLAAGRGISLPSLSAGAAQLAARTVGAYATIREQFGLPIGRFEGIEARLARIAGMAYTIQGARRLTLGAIDSGEKPSVLTAVMKAYSTEAMRVAVNDAMDVVGGAGICRGPRNVLAHAYQSVPIGITVEGANILTRSMIIFGQGAIRCHPYVQSELDAVAKRDLAAFDRSFWGHVGFVVSNAARAFVLGLSGGRLAAAPCGGPAGAYFQALSRWSAAYALAADVAMGTLGGSLKRKEALSGRLADALANLYLASGALKHFVDEGQSEVELPALRWTMAHLQHEIESALRGFLDNLPNRFAAWMLGRAVFPLGSSTRPPSDAACARLARAILDGGALRERLCGEVFVPEVGEPGLGRLEAALAAVAAAAPAMAKLKAAQKSGQLSKLAPSELLAAAARGGVLDAKEIDQLKLAESLRADAIGVDAFERESLADTQLGRRRALTR
jgi:acyl-CoA dehydrogenase